MVWGQGVTQQKIGLEGEGCRLDFFFEKNNGGGGISSEPYEPYVYRKYKKIRLEVEGVVMKNKNLKTLGGGLKFSVTPHPPYDIKWNNPY